jgi:hypothetical protein
MIIFIYAFKVNLITKIIIIIINMYMRNRLCTTLSRMGNHT